MVLLLWRRIFLLMIPRVINSKFTSSIILCHNKANKNSILLTHLYEFFGTLLGCSGLGQAAYPAYDGDESLYETHKFMDLSYSEVGYFIVLSILSLLFPFTIREQELACPFALFPKKNPLFPHFQAHTFIN